MWLEVGDNLQSPVLLAVYHITEVELHLAVTGTVCVVRQGGGERRWGNVWCHMYLCNRDTNISYNILQHYRNITYNYLSRLQMH